MLTVDGCLGFPELRNAVVVAGSGGLDRPVQFAHVVEEPDIESWIRPGLVILTTGHALGEERIQQRWFQQLDHHHAAAIIVACGRYLNHIPDSMRRQADRYQIPLIQVPWDIPFISITSAIHHHIIQQQTKDLAQLATMQTQMTKSALSARSLDELLQKFMGIVRIPVRVIPIDTLTDCPSFVIPQEDLRNWKLSFPRLVSGPRYSGAFLDQLGRHMATVTGLYLLREQVVRIHQQHAQTRLIFRLLENTPASPVPAWSDDFGLPFDASHNHYLVMISRTDEGPQKSQTFDPATLIRNALEDLHGLVSEITGHSIWLGVFDALNNPESRIEHTVEGILGKLPALRAILSEPVDVRDIPASYRMLRYLLPHAPEGVLSRSSTLVYYGVLSDLPPVPMASLWKATWGRVPDPLLRRTLAVWLDDDGNTARILEQLSIHRNTLRNRLKRIAKLLGTPLSVGTAHQLRLARDWHNAVDSPFPAPRQDFP